MNADPVVMEHFFHGVRTREETAGFMARIEQEFERRGFGLWAIEVRGTAPFIGFVGLHEAVSFTNVGNTRSQRVMRRIGMRRDSSGDFDHPAVPKRNPIRPQVLY